MRCPDNPVSVDVTACHMELASFCDAQPQVMTEKKRAHQANRTLDRLHPENHQWQIEEECPQWHGTKLDRRPHWHGSGARQIVPWLPWRQMKGLRHSVPLMTPDVAFLRARAGDAPCGARCGLCVWQSTGIRLLQGLQSLKCCSRRPQPPFSPPSRH